jgi:enoyl-CoA hydratase
MADGVDPVQVSIEDGVAVVRIDDGKANALSHSIIDALHAALDTASAEARSVCFVGRPGKLCAGFDLSVMTAGADATRGLVGAGGRLLMRIFGHGQPTVVAATGHSLAAGGLLLLACDTRIGADTPSAKIGLNETAIGMGMPVYGVELCRARLTPAAFVRGLLQAEIYDPAGAVAAGYLDSVIAADEVEAVAIAEARRLGQYKTSAYSSTKRTSRGAIIDAVLGGLDTDMANIVPPSV